MAGSNFNLLHVTSWLSRQGGGIPPVVWSLAQESKRLGLECLVAGLKDQYVEEDSAAYGLPYLAGSVVGPRALGFSPELGRLLRPNGADRGVIHSHGLWMHPGVLARKRSGKTGCPLIISPHGMLEPWALNRSRLKKRLVSHLFENRNLHSAHCLHALCASEAENIRHYGLRNPIAVIPNGISLDSLKPHPDREAITKRFPELAGSQRVLFLSRLHPKKGLTNLLRAWRGIQASVTDWRLVIAGPSELGHEEELKRLARELNIENSVFFLGPVYGEIKRDLLAAADIFVLPSFSEGFSMAILEAAAAGLPVLLTRQCNFTELAAAGAGVEISPDESAIENGLRSLLMMAEAERRAMGRRGLELVKHSYTWPAITRQMLEVYEWLLGNGPMPGTVQPGENGANVR